ncbi:hypothetical protein BHE74_00031843, partial [Ensete ventricosum]
MRTTRYRTVPSKIDRRRPIEGESTVDGRLREIGEKGKKKKRRRNRTSIVVARALSSPTGHPRAVAARTRGQFFSRARRQNVSPRGEKDRGD